MSEISAKKTLEKTRVNSFNQFYYVWSTSGKCGTVCLRWLDLLDRTKSTNVFYSSHTILSPKSSLLKDPCGDDKHCLGDVVQSDLISDPSELKISRLKDAGCPMLKVSLLALGGDCGKNHATAIHLEHDLIFDPNMGEWNMVYSPGDGVYKNLIAHYQPRYVSVALVQRRTTTVVASGPEVRGRRESVDGFEFI